MKRVVIGAAMLAALGGVAMAARSEPPPQFAPGAKSCAGKACIEFVDLTPRFLAFEKEARDIRDPDERFAIWQKDYGFAAVPPGPQGEAMARRLLDQGWPRYAAALPRIRIGGATMPPMALSALGQVMTRLAYRDPIDVRVVAYVGAFEGNAFSFAQDDQTVVNFPVENAPDELSRLEVHELTHAVHLKAASLPGGWERSIAQTVLMEGLAMRVTQQLRPGKPDGVYVSNKPGWFEAVEGQRAAVLSDILPVLEARDGATVWRYTIGQGGAGVEREAYLAGWFVVGRLREKGMSFAEIARVPEAEMPGLIRRTVAEMLR